MSVQHAATPSYTAQAPTILVIDDDVPTIELLNVAFALEGYGVVEATDGRLGLRQLLAHHPDLVLCDMLMPEIDGRGVAKAIHAHTAFRDVPLILMSACNVARVAGDIEYSAFIEKPFSVSALLDLVARLLAHAQASARFQA